MYLLSALYLFIGIMAIRWMVKAIKNAPVVEDWDQKLFEESENE